AGCTRGGAGPSSASCGWSATRSRAGATCPRAGCCRTRRSWRRRGCCPEASVTSPSSRGSRAGARGGTPRSGGGRSTRPRARPSRTLRARAPPLPGGPPRAPRGAERAPVAAQRLGAVRAAVAAPADEHSLPAENLLQPDVVRRLAWRPPQPPGPEVVGADLLDHGARPWQAELTAKPISKALTRLIEQAEDHPDDPGQPTHPEQPPQPPRAAPPPRP